MSQALAIPTVRELEAIDFASLTPAQRWDAEEFGEAFADRARELNDDELRRWVEVEGKTQTEIAELVGRSQATVSRRCSALGLETPRAGIGGRPSIQVNTDPEPIDAELVEGEVVADEPRLGVRKHQHQHRLVKSVVSRVEGVSMTLGEVDLSAVRQVIEEEEAEQWVQQLRTARTGLSRLISALEGE